MLIMSSRKFWEGGRGRNLTLACARCNLEKGTQSRDAFLATRAQKERRPIAVQKSPRNGG
jgi:hypothetical protein